MRDLFFLTSGSFSFAAAVILPPSLASIRSMRPVRLCNAVAVVVRDDGDVVLIDAGFSRRSCAHPRREIGFAYSLALGVRVRQGDAIADQLAALGVAPSRVKKIVATHLHFDHIGGACDFPDAEIVCTASELASAHKRGALGGYRKADLRSGKLVPVTLAGAGRHGFSASHDLFGDGEVVLLDASGHTAGSVAVALREAGDRYTLHVGDAVYQSWEYGADTPGPSLFARGGAWRLDLLVQRYGELRASQTEAPPCVIVPSHDFTVFDGLPHAPSRAAA